MRLGKLYQTESKGKVGKEYTTVFNILQVAAHTTWRRSLHAAVSTNNGAMGNEEAASKN